VSHYGVRLLQEKKKGYKYFCRQCNEPIENNEEPCQACGHDPILFKCMNCGNDKVSRDHGGICVICKHEFEPVLMSDEHYLELKNVAKMSRFCKFEDRRFDYLGELRSYVEELNEKTDGIFDDCLSQLLEVDNYYHQIELCIEYKTINEAVEVLARIKDSKEDSAKTAVSTSSYRYIELKVNVLKALKIIKDDIVFPNENSKKG